jgi:hypothetical protein
VQPAADEPSEPKKAKGKVVDAEVVDWLNLTIYGIHMFEKYRKL